MIRKPTCEVDITTFRSRALEGNALGDPAERELILILPPGYRDSAARYPVIWVLAGFFGNGRMILNRNFSAPALDERISGYIQNNAMPEAIFALPDCMTALGGSQYLNSPAVGNYENYLCDELIPHVDKHYRTIPEGRARGVLGKSSGGYGALRLSMKRPGMFGAAASHSGDCYFEYCHVRDVPVAVNAIRAAGSVEALITKIKSTEKPRHDDSIALLSIAMAACYSPDAGSARGYALPFDVETGEINDSVMQRWYQNDPVRMVDEPGAIRALQSMHYLFLDCGTRDEWALHLGLRILVKKLRGAAVPCVHEEFDDDHMSISYRYDRSIPQMAAALVRAAQTPLH